LAAPHTPLADALRQLAGVTAVTPGEEGPQYRVSFHREQTSPNAILQLALDSGAQIVAFQEQTRHLNEAFMDLTEPGVPPVIPPTFAPPPPVVPRTDPWNDAEAPPR
jgi:ABC-2 type transport system ATP-binding protein